MKGFWMVFLAFATLLCLASLLSAVSSRAARGAAVPAAADGEQIGRWIAQLGDNDFDAREAASRALEGREEAIPALRKALKSPDAEVRKRAADLLEARDRKRAPGELDRAMDMAKNGRIDEAVERLVRWQGLEETAKGWEAVYPLATRAAEAADHAIKPDSAAYRPDVLRFFPPRSSYQKLVGPQPTEVGSPPTTLTSHSHFLLRGESIKLDTDSRCASSIIAASRSVRLSSPEIIGVIVVCGGPVEVYRLNRSIVICDGDFTARQGCCDCVIIAHGKVTCGSLTGGLFICASEVNLARGVREKCTVRTGNAAPLGFIHFFDPAEAGVEASAVDDADGGRVPDGVVVTGVAKDKAFATAGLRVGDVITAVGDEKVVAADSARDQFDSFRQPLRKALAADDDFPLTVRRGDKVLELTVHPPD